MLTNFKLVDNASGRAIVERLDLAANYWSRLRGLQFRAGFPAGQAMLLVPCRSIHTMFVRIPIDVVFLSAAGEVLEVRQSVRPWRLVLAPHGTHAVLEMPAGAAPMNAGDHISIAASESVAAKASDGAPATPKSLRFLASDRS